MLEEVELELNPESGTGDDWSSLRKSKPPGGRRRLMRDVLTGCLSACSRRPGGEHTAVTSYLSLGGEILDLGGGYD
jgi:hypothetical protein